MKNITHLFVSFASLAAFAAPQFAKADLFLHSNFDIQEGYQRPLIPIPDLTNRNTGVGYGDFARGSLNHSLSPGSSGNRASGFTGIAYSSIADEFNQNWYGSFLNRFNAQDGGGVFISFSPASNQTDEMGIAVLPMGVILNYGADDTYVLQRTSGLVDHFVLMQFTTNQTGNSLLQLWIDPTDASNPGEPMIAYNFTVVQPFTNISVQCMGSGPQDSMDELRFGTTINDVAVVPAPATSAMFFTLALAARRRR